MILKAQRFKRACGFENRPVIVVLTLYVTILLFLPLDLLEQILYLLQVCLRIRCLNWFSTREKCLIRIFCNSIKWKFP